MKPVSVMIYLWKSFCFYLSLLLSGFNKMMINLTLLHSLPASVKRKVKKIIDPNIKVAKVFFLFYQSMDHCVYFIKIKYAN